MDLFSSRGWITDTQRKMQAIEDIKTEWDSKGRSTGRKYPLVSWQVLLMAWQLRRPGRSGQLVWPLANGVDFSNQAVFLLMNFKLPSLILPGYL
jgi:hypothetical protein